METRLVWFEHDDAFSPGEEGCPSSLDSQEATKRKAIQSSEIDFHNLFRVPLWIQCLWTVALIFNKADIVDKTFDPLFGIFKITRLDSGKI